MCSRNMLTSLIGRRFGLDKFFPVHMGIVRSALFLLGPSLDTFPDRDLPKTYNEHNVFFIAMSHNKLVKT